MLRQRATYPLIYFGVVDVIRVSSQKLDWSCQPKKPFDSDKKMVCGKINFPITFIYFALPSLFSHTSWNLQFKSKSILTLYISLICYIAA